MILYKGPSRIDGKPIVAIATIGSKNEKTGDMVQVWILRENVHPVVAQRTGSDESVCGDCPQRWSLGGACYVIVAKAPASVWKAYKHGSYNCPKHIAKVEHELRTKPIRLGAYGDPCAVPFDVWESLIAQGTGSWTGYTHQWKNPANANYRQLVMASCDSIQEAEQANAQGWRFFVVVTDIEDALRKSPLMGVVVQCASDANGINCATCKACDGTRADSRSGSAASIMIQVHGMVKNRFLTVVR